MPHSPTEAPEASDEVALPLSTATPSPTDTPTPSPTSQPTVATGSGPADRAVTCQASCWPLTGKPLDGNATLRPIALRYDNATPSQPQAGINSADVVFDTIIEACVSRFLAVFHSRTAPTLGSVRSARLYDLQLTPMLRGALAHVGAADEVSQMIRDANARGDFVDVDAYKFKTYPDYGSYYWRIGWKSPPYNLYTSSASLRGAANAAPGGAAAVSVPDWGFLHAVDHDPAAGGFAQSVAATSFRLPSAGGAACPQGQNVLGYRSEYAPTYAYDATQRGYRRSTNGRTTTDETTGVAVLARNVILIYSDLSVTDIVESSGGWGVAYSIRPRTTGSGRLSIYRDGRRVDGTWSRASNFDAFELRNGSGERILLAPGQTWVHIVPSYWNVQ